MFTFRTTVKLHDTDAAGIVFFANQFKMAHDAYEAFLESIDFPVSHFLNRGEFCLPIVHAESDFLESLHVGEKVSIDVKIDNIGETSFTLSYQLFNEEKKLVGKVKTAHVSVDRKSGEKIRLPKHFRDALQLQFL